MFRFLKSDRKLLAETGKRGLLPSGNYPKSKSIFQNLKFYKVLRIHIYVRNLGFFEPLSTQISAASEALPRPGEYR